MGRLLCVLMCLALSRARALGSRHCSVVTWNLLAPCFAPPSKYPWAPPEALDWLHRRGRIVSQLAALDADVVCLQEVQRPLWDELAADFSSLGYDTILQDSSSNKAKHPIANAVLLRRGHVELVRAESRSRALITVLRAAGDTAADSEQESLYLANVHLEAGADKAAMRQSQLRSLLKRLEFQRSVDVAKACGRPRALSPTADVTGAPIVIAGDFNCDRRSPLHTLLAEGALPTEVPAPGPRVRSALLPLTDAYAANPPPWGPPLRSSYRNGRILDFIWTSPTVSVLRTMPVCNAAGSSQPHRIPCRDLPSDHMPIGALLSWPGAPLDGSGGDRPAWQQLCVENVMRRGSDQNWVSG
mmetsp:Transcript_9796/g.29148  ORF Transcript_9796/g.29148 Transcript_9796/m.29148 type:complete len:357 (-) Transcript_9796:445-1515(-)